MIQKIWNSATRSSQEWPLMLIENFVLLKIFFECLRFFKNHPQVLVDHKFVES